MQLRYILLPCLVFGAAHMAVADATSTKNGTSNRQASSVGTWVRNTEESFNLPHPVAMETVVIRRADKILDYTWTGTDAEGHKISFNFTGPIDGKFRDMTGDFDKPRGRPGLSGDAGPAPWD